MLPKKPLKIVLTGGPGAGKTAVLELCRTEFTDRIVIVPEAATLLYGGGFPRYANHNGVKCAQESIYFIQKKLEEMQALHFPKASLLCDRGTLDGAAYWPKGPKNFFKSLKTTLKKELAGYDAVLFLQSAAAHGDCIRSGNLCRTESPEEAVKLDNKLKRLWSKHPHFHFVPCQTTLELKIQISRAAFEKVLATRQK